MADYFNSRPASSEARTYVTINGTDMRTYGLELTGYKIGAPIPVINLIDVPGRMGKLDASDALNGYVSYSGRSIELRFHTQKNFSEWHGLISALSGAFDGVESKVIFSKDPEWYYKGRFTIDFIKSNPISGDVVLSCKDCFPFKLKAFSDVIELSGGMGRGWGHPVDPNWKYFSEITIIEAITTHSASTDDVIYTCHFGYDSSSSRFTIKEGDKKYYDYHGLKDVISTDTMTFGLQPSRGDLVSELTVSFEVGVF